MPTPVALETVRSIATAHDELLPTPSAAPLQTAMPAAVTPTILSASPATATTAATQTSQPVIAVTRVAKCCGVFGWIDAQHLLVFDTPAQGQTGASVVDVKTGSRQFVSANFGIPSPSGLIAFPDRSAGRTEIRRSDGSVVSTISNGGVLTWISRDGQHVAWLEDLSVTQVSSLVPRTVRFWSAGIDGSHAKLLLEFDASALQWLPDNQHVVALGRTPDGRQPGIWLVDTVTGTNGVAVAGTFLQALRLSPNASRMAYLETFSGSISQDGVWIANTNGTDKIHLREAGSFRWGGDSSYLWFLDLAPRDGGNDTLVEVDVSDDAVVGRIDLGGRVLNDQWDVSPDGSAVAYWSEADQTVVVKALTR